MKYIAKNKQVTMEIGKKMTANLKGGDILCLYGDLGAGKTTFVKGLAKGLGIKKDITSPTFALMNIYPVKSHTMDSRLPAGQAGLRGNDKVKQIIHIDTYRLKDEKELIDIGVEDYLGAADTICVIEWPEKMHKLLNKKKTLKIKIEHLNNGRKITSP